VDVTGQSGSTTPADGNGRHGEGDPANGWADSWSGAGSALEPEPDSGIPAWRRRMDALGQSRTQTPPRYAEILANAGVRPAADQAEIPEGSPHLFEAYDVGDPPEFIPGPTDAFDGFPDGDPLGGPFEPPPFGRGDEPATQGSQSGMEPQARRGALEENTPPQGTPNPFARLLAVPPVPSAPPASGASTYPVSGQAPPAPPGLRPPTHFDRSPPDTAAASAAAPVSGGAAPVSGPGRPASLEPPVRQGPVEPLPAGPPFPPNRSQPPGYPAQPMHVGPPEHPQHSGHPQQPGHIQSPGYMRQSEPVHQPGSPGQPEGAAGQPGFSGYPPPRSAQPGTSGGPSVLTPPGVPPDAPGGLRIPGSPGIYGTGPDYAGSRPRGPGGGQDRAGQDGRAAYATLEPGFEELEPELQTQVDEREQARRTDLAHGLPQRVPAEPDVPGLAEQVPASEPPAPAPVLSRVASGLRRDDLPPAERPDVFDVAAVLSAVRNVPGVRDAQLRATATGGHTLRLDLADGSDPAYVSRVVARMLNERMGLIAEPPVPPRQPGPPRPVSTVPMQDGAYSPVAAYAEDGSPTGRVPFPPAQRSGPPLPPGLIPASSAPREPRRRHPVTMRGRYPTDQRPGGLISNDHTGRDEHHEPGRPPALTPPTEARRVVLDHVQVSTFGLDATVEVRLVSGDRVAMGVSNGPAVDGYVLRLCAAAAANAVDELLGEAAETQSGRGHCYVEQAAIVPMGSCEVAVVVVLLVCDGWVEQLAGSALVSGDPRQAVVRATLAAVNRRLTALLP
jgi:hypothetical protein